MSRGNRTRRIAAGLLPAPVKCSAHKKDGTSCNASPIRGAKVCRAHGGAAPQVKAKAAERLREGVMPMLAALYRIANDEAVPPAVRLGAIKDWLDRSAIKEAIMIEVRHEPWEILIDGLVAEVDDESIRGISRIMRGDDSPDAEIYDAELVTAEQYDQPRPKALRVAAERGPVTPPTRTAPAHPKIPSRRRRNTNGLGR